MRNKNLTKDKSSKKYSMGILFGIPILLFAVGIALISAGTYNYMKYAYFFSRIFIKNEVKLASNKTVSKEEKKITFPILGQEFGQFSIDSAKINAPIIEGDREKDLLDGVGHFTGSRYPGEGGNVVLLGHRNSVFVNMKNVKKGDLITLDLTYGKYVYKVSNFKIVDKNDKSILQPQDKEMLTIYTCYPFDYIGHAPSRYVVTCDLVEGTPLKELILKDSGGK